MKKVVFVWVTLVSLVSCDVSDRPDYQYKTIVGDSSYSDWKDGRAEAIEAAHAEFEGYTKSICRRAISNGWSLFKLKNEGVMNCERTPEGHHCRKKNVELECRQVSEFFP